jgi:RNA polymerase sigma-70 factor (ECF subfamily)
MARYLQRERRPPGKEKVMTTTDYAQAYETGLQKTVRFLRSRGVEPSTAEESAQAAWARGWEKRKHLKEAKQVVQWVNTIALNIFRGRYRKESREEALPVREFAVDPENRVARVDLAKSAAQCSKRDWLLLTAHYVDGYTSEEIAERMDLNPVTVRVRISRAKSKVRAFLVAGAPTGHGRLGAMA